MFDRRTVRLAAGVALLGAVALALPGCNEEPATDDGGGLTGRIRIDGSSTVYPISEAVASAFKKQYPKVDPEVGRSGTGGGFKVFTKGDADITGASRPIKQSEFDAARENGIQFIELPVAYDGLTIVVNPANDWADRLTIDDLKKIFLEPGGATTWKDVNADWPAEPIKIYAPGTDSGTFDYFKEVVAGEKGSLRSDMSTSEDDNVLVTGVAGEAGNVGFFGASYYFNNKDKVRAVPIVNPETGEAVAPTPEAVESGDYAPFSRPLFIYINKDKLRPEVQKFTEYFLDHAAEMAEKVDYVPLPQAVYDKAREHYKKRTTGTHFLTEDGKKRSGPVTEVYMRDDNLLKTKS